jgi:hypothetical protein
MANTHPTTSQSCFGNKAMSRINPSFIVDLGLALMLICEKKMIGFFRLFLQPLLIDL